MLRHTVKNNILVTSKVRYLVSMRSDRTFWWWSYSPQGLSFSLVESCRVLWVVNHIAVYDWRGVVVVDVVHVLLSFGRSLYSRSCSVPPAPFLCTITNLEVQESYLPIIGCTGRPFPCVPGHFNRWLQVTSLVICECRSLYRHSHITKLVTFTQRSIIAKLH